MDRAKLYELAQRQKLKAEALCSLEDLVVSYARAQGLTDEPEAAQAEAKRMVDHIVDALEPEDWSGLAAFKSLIGEQPLRDLMLYSFRRSYDDLIEKAREVERLPEPEPTETDEDTDAAELRRRQRRRDLDR